MYQFKYLKNKLHLSSFVLNDETLRSGEQCLFTLNPTFLLCNPSKQLIQQANNLLHDFCKLDIGNMVGYYPISGNNKYTFKTSLDTQDGKIVLKRDFKVLCKDKLPYAYFEDTNDYLIFTDKVNQDELLQQYRNEHKCAFCGRSFGRTKKKVIDNNNQIMHVNCWQESSKLIIEDVKLICYAILQTQKAINEYQIFKDDSELSSDNFSFLAEHTYGVIMQKELEGNHKVWQRIQNRLGTMLLIAHLKLDKQQIINCYTQNRLPQEVTDNIRNFVHRDVLCLGQLEVAKAINVMQQIELTLDGKSSQADKVKAKIVNDFINNTETDPDLDNYHSYRAFAQKLMQSLSISATNESSGESGVLMKELTIFLCDSESSGSHLDYLGKCMARAFIGYRITKIELDLLFQLKRNIAQYATYPKREWQAVMNTLETVNPKIIDSDSGKVVTKNNSKYNDLKKFVDIF